MTIAAQTQTVADDRPCASCGYNLRGQSATWDRPTGQWRATCPECGTPQATSVGGAAVTAHVSWVHYATIAVAAWLLWHALGLVAAGVTRLMATPVAAGTAAAANLFRGGGRAAAAAASPNVLDADVYVIMSHVALAVIPLALAAMACGAIVAAAPFANARQRLIVALSAVGVAWLVGTWMSLSGYADADNDRETTAVAIRVLTLVNGGRAPAGTVAGTTPVDMQWRFVSGITALLAATLGARFGLFFGGPLATMLRQMYLPGTAARPEAR